MVTLAVTVTVNSATLRKVPGMGIPVEMRRRPPVSTLNWVERAIGPAAQVVRVRRLRNAWASAMHAVDVEDGGGRHRLVLRRWARTDITADPYVVENEAAALEYASSAGLPVPRLVAADPKAEACDAPALLMTRLPGRDQLAPARLDPWLDGLVRALKAIHAVPPPEPGDLFIPYETWNLGIVVAPPPWSAQAGAWERAIEIVEAGPPSGALADSSMVLCHHDFHPGNVLWRRGKVSGLVDWTHACRGPEAVAHSHCRMELTRLFGLDVADEFARRYGPVPSLPWFDVAEAFGTGDRPPEAWRWADAGRPDLTRDLLIEREDAFLLAALRRYA
jgi:phosphotransferase family enzyme